MGDGTLMSVFNRDQWGDPSTWGTMVPNQRRRAPGELVTGESAAPGIYKSMCCSFAVRVNPDNPVLGPCRACANSCGWIFDRAAPPPGPPRPSPSELARALGL